MGRISIVHSVDKIKNIWDFGVIFCAGLVFALRKYTKLLQHLEIFDKFENRKIQISR